MIAQYADEAALIKAGHVGISFDDGKTIFGFHPAANAVKGLSSAEIIAHLRNRGSYPGQVYDDTAIFLRVHELGQQGALSRGSSNAPGVPLSVYQWRQELPIAQVDQIRNSVLQQLADPSITSSRYSFPDKGPTGYFMPPGCNNCATWPSIEGVQIPESSGRLSNYIELLIERGGGAIWTP
ncbi:MAG: hypothetical protein R3A44_21460 [Caldilineaceae bacterium]